VITHGHGSRMVGTVPQFVLILGQLEVRFSQSDLIHDAQRLRFDLFPRSWLRFAGLDHHAGNRNGFRDD
jgi:hypothetical protein